MVEVKTPVNTAAICTYFAHLIMLMALIYVTPTTTSTTTTTPSKTTVTTPHTDHKMKKHQHPTHLHYLSQSPYANAGSGEGIIKSMLQKGLFTACGKSFRSTENITEMKTNSRLIDIVTEQNRTRIAQLLNMTSIQDDDVIFVGPTSFDQFGAISPLFRKIKVTKSRAVLVMRKGSVLLLPKFLGTFVNSLTVVAFAILCAIFVAAVVWVVETGFGTGHFPESPGSGMWSSFWFIMVTMTTVGYGDKTPKHPLSRIIVMGWLVFGLMLVALITASAWNAINAQVNVRHKNIAALNHSSEASLIVKKLLANPVHYKDYPSIFKAVRSNESITAALVDQHIAAEFMKHKEENDGVVIERKIEADLTVMMYAHYNDLILGCAPNENSVVDQAKIEDEILRLVELKTNPIQIDPYVLRQISDIFDGTDNGLIMYMTMGAAIIVALAAVGELVYRLGSFKGKGRGKEEEKTRRYSELRNQIEKFVEEEVEYAIKRKADGSTI